MRAIIGFEEIAAQPGRARDPPRHLVIALERRAGRDQALLAHMRLDLRQKGGEFGQQERARRPVGAAVVIIEPDDGGQPIGPARHTADALRALLGPRLAPALATDPPGRPPPPPPLPPAAGALPAEPPSPPSSHAQPYLPAPRPQ